MARTQERSGKGIEIPHVPTIEPGSLAWVPQADPPEAEDLLVHAAFQFLARPGALNIEQAREFGRALGKSANPEEVSAFLDAYSHLGIGSIALAEDGHGRYIFEAKDIPIEGSARPMGCAIALGFLEGLVQAAAGHTTLGAETACRSRGASSCRFVVMPKG